jgi:hypothetical protein
LLNASVPPEAPPLVNVAPSILSFGIAHGDLPFLPSIRSIDFFLLTVGGFEIHVSGDHSVIMESPRGGKSSNYNTGAKSATASRKETIQERRRRVFGRAIARLTNPQSQHQGA